ncbi:MAG TPA: hypothetical protein ENK88_08180, partial [Campylobacterales bacterium]|nr:hypothetical protein [Campylobacterales bacterium]
MERRNFLRGLCVMPIIGLTPTIGFATEGDNPTPPQTSGLDRVITIIQNDKRLNKKVTPEDIQDAINSAKRMNEIILEAIVNTGVANDKKISTADTRELNDYIFHNYHDEWVVLHGDDEEDSETGFHKVVNDGARTKLYGKNAINKIFDSIYHLGFDTHLKNRLLNEDGNKNASYKHVAIWLDSLLHDDLENGTLSNPNIKEIVGQTQTGLDKSIDIIYTDKGLQKRISTGDIRIGANSANEMNKLIIESIEATDAGASGSFTIQNVKDMNAFLVDNYASRWALLHGDDEDDEETGYHKVQSDGAKTKLFGKNAINRVFDGIYHLGFKTTYKNRLVNEDGNKNASFKKVAQWLTGLMADDLDNQKEDLKILIPLYSYPSKDSQYNEIVWQKLIDIQNSHPNAEIVAIVNPNNGNFREKDANYSDGIKKLIEAKIKVVGYVYTKYGKRDTTEVVDDIEAWSNIYKADGVSGIFFDETSTNSSDLTYYTNLSNEARTRELDFVILNPGITTDPAYIDSGIANIVTSYENPNRELLENPPATYNTPSQTTELSLLIYEME